MKIYFDVCCLNRPFDDQTQARIRLEKEAIVLILARLTVEDLHWLTSPAVTAEIKQTPDLVWRYQMLSLLGMASGSINITHESEERSKELIEFGFKPFDALHLALAEQGDVDIFLTVDDQLIRLANRLEGKVRVPVSNPLTWIRE